MIDIRPDTIVRDIVVQWPQTRRILEHHGVDYCCNGQMPLKAATDRAGVDYERVVADLEREVESPAASGAVGDWSGVGMSELSDHILDTHHTFMRRQMPRIDSLLKTVLAAHKPHAEMLSVLRQTFVALRAEIEMHLEKEEQILFPYIKDLDRMAAGEMPFASIHCGSVSSPIAQMEHEHDAAGTALAKMRQLTSNYTLPEDACPTFAELYQSLRELEADLHEHIHLENNILFPKAVETEARVESR